MIIRTQNHDPYKTLLRTRDYIFHTKHISHNNFHAHSTHPLYTSSFSYYMSTLHGMCQIQWIVS
jgi:hypothetical protein